jgi:hypothetical protein
MKVGSDYEDEMDRLDPRSIDAALRGRPTGQPALDRAAQVVAEVRRTLLEEPRPDVATRHLAAMTAAARGLEWGPRQVHRASPVRLRRRVAGLAVAAAVAIGGVAAAVTLPDRTDEPERRGGQTERDRRNAGPTEDRTDPTHGKEVSDTAHDDSLSGCEKGQAVSDVASSKSNGGGEQPQDPCVKGDEGSNAGGQGRGRGKPAKDEKEHPAKQTKEKDRGPDLKDDTEPGSGGPPETGGSSGTGGPSGSGGSSGSGGPPDHAAAGGSGNSKGKS